MNEHTAVVNDPDRNSAVYIDPTLPLLVGLDKDGNPETACLLGYSTIGLRGLGKELESNKELSPLLTNICRQ